jgi:hypothetical protein
MTGIRSDSDIDDSANSDKNNDGIAFIFRRVMGPNHAGKDSYCEVDIQSKGLRNLLAVRNSEYSYLSRLYLI